MAVIMAFDNSTDLPRKLTRRLGEKPLLSHALAIVSGAARIKAIVVATDDDEVALLAERSGVIGLTIDRQKVPNELALANQVIDLVSPQGLAGDYLLLFSAPTPLIRSSDLDKAIGLLGRGKADSVVSARRIKQPAWNLKGGVFAGDYDLAELNRPEEVEMTEGFIV
ncbi:MAG: hypothetical protein JRC92_07800, partial [Deltaproteobacteria bacterium]|nr:hypothetical protein [Deltaproteobacteria bacterium]